MFYGTLMAIQIFFMGMTMNSDDKTNLINEILQLREEIRSIAVDETLDDDRKRELIYRLMPTTDEKHWHLFVGGSLKYPDREEKIGNFDLDDAMETELIYDAPKRVPPHLIIEKFADIIRDNPLDVEAIINATNAWGDRPQWPVFTYYIDFDLFPQAPGGEYEELEDHQQKRADEFQRILKTKSDDFLIRFMLLAAFSPGGSYANSPDNDYEMMWDGEAFHYAEGELYDSFPAWYRQWNKLVPTMCARISGIAPQKLCLDPNSVDEGRH